MQIAAPTHPPRTALELSPYLAGISFERPAGLDESPRWDLTASRAELRDASRAATDDWDALIRKTTARLTASVAGLDHSPQLHSPAGRLEVKISVLECVAALEQLRLAKTPTGAHRRSHERTECDSPRSPLDVPITDLRSQVAIEQARQKMAESMAVVAHELRNPLMPIRTAAALMGRVPAGELPRLQAIIERQVTRMTSLIADLIDVARLDAGKLRLQLQVTDMRAIVAEALDDCQPAFQARAQQLVVELPPSSLEVNGDPGRLLQIVCNLLDNAAKYTPNGGQVGVCVTTAGNEVRLTVSDSGIGMSPEGLPHVFERFAQEAHAIDFNKAGLGIGLSVVRDLVHAHGGAVQAQSAGLGNGSRFVVTLPLLRGDMHASEGHCLDRVTHVECHSDQAS